MNRETLARAAHEINRAYCAALGDISQPVWEDAPKWQKDSAFAGVDMHLANPDATPEASHESWLEQKTKDGWKFGPVKDAKKKEHPCFCAYRELPAEQKAKDYLFRAVVHTLKNEADAIVSVPQIKVVDSGFLSVKYIGNRAEYTDGTFGTRIHFIQGESRLVPMDKARQMLKHPDVYVPGDEDAPVALVPVDTQEQDNAQDMRDAIAVMGKDALASYAGAHFKIDLDKRKGVEALRAQVTQLVDQFGVA